MDQKLYEIVDYMVPLLLQIGWVYSFIVEQSIVVAGFIEDVVVVVVAKLKVHVLQ